MPSSSFRSTSALAVAAILTACSGSEFSSAERLPATNLDAGAGAGGAGAGGASSAGKSGKGGAQNQGGGTSNGGTTAGAGGAAGSGAGGGSAGSGLVGDGSVEPGSGGSTQKQDAGSSGGASAGGTNGQGGVVTCVPIIFYPDNDQDKYGRSTGTVSACAPPPNGTWATVGGDCDDDDAEVHPSETTYFESPHATASGNHSFDYDCSGNEEGDPSQLGAAPKCVGLLGIGCTGTGYVPTTRTGAGVNPLCGSRTQSTCSVVNLVCTGVLADVSVAYRCK